MPTAEESEALKTPSREVKTLIDSVLLSVMLNSSILSCQVINDHMSKYAKLLRSWPSKNYGFEFLKSINFVAREEVVQSIRQTTCHTLIIDESNDISLTKILILYIKYCTADDCLSMTKTVFERLYLLLAVTVILFWKKSRNFTLLIILIFKKWLCLQVMALLSCLVNEIV